MVSQAPNVLDQYAALLRDLVNQHKQLDDDRLALAIAYTDDRNHDLFLMEVLEKRGFLGQGFIFQGASDLRVHEIASTPGFPLAADQTLHLILTNPVELQHALAANYPLAESFRQAVRSGRYLALVVKPEANVH